ncbi:putative dimethylaniline monooxygenase (N-oxide-forming) [Suillus bovinus]|uniref:putative dimethylaniline monooxygenase (N-oxide-forming) n=1 Tax=Suillus bovinus TaxID=48563 RepID=UPI001B887382|nr:putative dimethylaniline monooxygenase (N-oxide-forming) [Suillus bovinus]KAG2143520.1 putative dimethylaniline monooxygenase (N-oxide-forming) [Suillus bovinus]
MSGIETFPVPLSAEAISSTWLSAFISDISSPSFTLKRSFTNDSYWRDLLAFTPDFRTLHALPKIQDFFSAPIALARPSRFRLLPSVRHRRIGPTKTFIQGIVQFHTVIAQCTGVFTLTQVEDSSWKAWSFVTMMDQLSGVVDRFRAHTPLCRPAEWNTTMEYTAVVVGAGQCGLSMAARLENLGISTLVLERSCAIGNGWRSRYESLETNTPRAFNHLPFVSFPEECGTYIPCRDVADYLENYQRTLGLHVLTSAHISTTSYDASSSTWTLSISFSGQASITVKAHHLIVAIGVGTTGGALPFAPSIRGKSSFLGSVIHSSEYRSSSCIGTQKVVVVGAGCSAHDIAQDIANHGSQTVLVQRSPTAVVSRQTINHMIAGYIAQDAPPTEIADRLYVAIPLSALQNSQYDIVEKHAHIDQDLKENLARHGYLLPGPEDNFLHRLSVRRGGYYIDRGCAQLITSGKITVKSGHEISHFSPSGLVFDDGSRVVADLVIFATGYSKTTIKQVAENLFGPQVADAVHDLGGWDSDYELAGVWRPTGHDGLWFAEGDLFSARFYSRFLALQIMAREMGIAKSRPENLHPMLISAINFSVTLYIMYTRCPWLVFNNLLITLFICNTIRSYACTVERTFNCRRLLLLGRLVQHGPRDAYTTITRYQ